MDKTRIIGIIGAMNIEIEGILAQMTNVTTTNAAGIDFHQGNLGDKAVVLARCGVGKVNAALCTQALLDRFPVKAIINLGVAGAIDNTLNIKDVVISRHLVQHDFDITAAGDREPGEISDLGVELVADAALVAAAAAACKQVLSESGSKAYEAPIATGDQFVADKSVKQRISDIFGAFCVEMEGGAIAQVCLLNNVPFVVIRAISDKADGSATQDFMEFVAEAAENSTKIVSAMIADI